MHSEKYRKATRQASLHYISAALLAYGAVGVASQVRLLPLLAEGLLSWLRPGSPPSSAWLGPLQEHYDALPWLPWAAWLLAVGLLHSTRRVAATVPHNPNPKVTLLRWVAPAILLFLLLVGGYLRMSLLWPQSVGISQLPYDDEGVYAGTSQLFLQGIMPYRDYFFAHPPIAAISYAPALAYHFTEWGSPTSFMMARYLSVAYSLLTLALLFLIGNRMAGLWGGTLAGALWALDGRVVEINRKIMLDGPMVLLSCAALLLYLKARPMLTGESTPTRPRRLLLLLMLAAFCSIASALTKIAGISCFIAILVDIIWIQLEAKLSGKPTLERPRFLPQLLAFSGGALLATALVVGPFLLLAPSQFVRDVFFFQLLRPSDGLIDVSARMADLSSTLSNAGSLLFAGLGFLVLSFSLWRRRAAGQWRVAVLWTFFSVLLFTYSRSFYGHYYIQLAAPLCLLGAGVSLLPNIRREPDKTNPLVKYRLLLPAALLALAALPLLVTQWSAITTRRENRVFEVVARYTNDAVPPGTSVLATDEQFNFLAARPPSHNATGYLIDSYGHMISLGLGLPTRSWDDLWSAALHGEHNNDVYATMQRPAPQADILDRAASVPLIVIHDKGFARLTSETVGAIEKGNKAVERHTLYTIYRAEK